MEQTTVTTTDSNIVVPQSSTTSTTKSTPVRFNIDRQCPIENVTVYNDRAEVTRRLQHNFDGEGVYDLVLEGFSPSVDHTSLRVSGGIGKACTILEVSYQISDGDKTTTTKTDSRPLDELRNELTEISSQIALHEKEVARLDKQRTWLDGRSTKLMNQDGQVSGNDLDVMSEFMNFYRQTLMKLDDQTANEQVEIKKLTEVKNELTSKITQYGAKVRPNREKDRYEVTITVHIGGKNLDVSLEISYLIGNCSWTASYDVRVNSQELAQQTTQLTYYGIIVNKSEENWMNAQLSLSTATPSLGGSAPKLTTLKIDYYRPRHFNNNIAKINCMMKQNLSMDLERGEHLDELCSRAQDLSTESSMFYCSAKKMSRPRLSFRGRSSLSSKEIAEENHPITTNTVNVLSTTTEAGMSSSSFAIPRRSTIDADGKPHKVTIAVLDLTSEFIYTVIPKLSLHAYLKAKTINTSDKQLLAGPAAVFMDNNFITHSAIDNVCLGDTFDLPLGTDTSVKVDYKPVKKLSETQGLISKTHHENIRREIRLTNTKSTAIAVHVYEQVPLSSDEKIKVKLVVPDLKVKEQNPNCTVTLDENNNLEWKCILAEKGECRLPLEYTLEWPNDKRIEYKE